VGFAGGTKESPTYRSLGEHTETVELDWDPAVTSYKNLLDIFWNNHDPTTSCSRQYMSAIFYHSEEQRSEAEKSMKVAQENNRRNITTLILPAKEFYNAEHYHQKYLLRKHDWLVSALDLQDDNKMIISSVAARINGYIGGYGDEVSFESERTLLNLDDEVYDYVLEEIRSKAR